MAILFVERSALLRLGARLTAGDVGVRAPFVDRAAPPQWGSLAPGNIGDLPIVLADHWLGWSLLIEDSRLRDALEDPELVGALLDDLAEGLALAADTAFLNGGAPAPDGVKLIPGVEQVPAAADALATAREMLTRLRTAPTPVFRNPGWILHPTRLDELSIAALPTGPADSTRLLKSNGTDGGTFLGYPFVVSEAAVDGGGVPAMFFSADWSEAWIAAEREIVGVRVSAAGAAGVTQTQIRVVARMSFALRRPEFFVAPL